MKSYSQWQEELEQQRRNELKAALDIDEPCSYSNEELEEMLKEKTPRGFEGKENGDINAEQS